MFFLLINLDILPRYLLSGSGLCTYVHTVHLFIYLFIYLYIKRRLGRSRRGLTRIFVRPQP